EQVLSDGYTGVQTATISDEDMAALWEDGMLTLDVDVDDDENSLEAEVSDAADDSSYGSEHSLSEIAQVTPGTGLVLEATRGSALARVVNDHTIRLVKGDTEVFGVRGRSAEQRLAI